MKITLEKLKELDACTAGIYYFIENFGNEANPDDVIAKIYEDKCNRYAIWLAKEFKLSGEYKSWFFNGQISEISNFENGKLHGEYKSWDWNGQQDEICNYENGKLHGEYKSWHDNGQTLVICNYKNGNRHGEYKSWHENGQQWEICNYKNGVKIN